MNYFFLIATLFFSVNMQSHGFGEQTFIRAAHKDGPIKGCWAMNQVVRLAREDKKQYVVSYDEKTDRWVSKKIKSVGQSKASCCCRISFNKPSLDMICTPTQVFYRMTDKQWVPAYMLNVGDFLLCEGHTEIQIAALSVIPETTQVYALEIEDTHTFLVGMEAVVAHNIAIPWQAVIGFSISYDLGVGGCLGGVTLGPVGLVGGIALGGVASCVIKYCTRERIAEYDVELEPEVLRSVFGGTSSYAKSKGKGEEKGKEGDKGKEEAKDKEKDKDGKAPGKPNTEEDGFVPEKKWDGRKVKHPHTGQRGYPNEDGNLWVPSGESGHGGPHWDIIDKKGKHIGNVHPGGHIRGAK